MLKRLLASLALLGSAGALAQGEEPVARVDNPQTLTEVFLERGATRAGEPLALAVRFTPAEGWHTYWENYGDSGKAPWFEWSLPEGWRITGPLYPVPETIPVGPLMNYGYHAPQTLLFSLVPPADAAPGRVPVGMFSEWLVCEEICIPETGDFAFSVGIGDGAAEPLAPELFSAARAALPNPSPWSASARMSERTFEIALAMPAEDAALVTDAHYFPIEDGLLDYAKPQAVARDARGLVLTIARPGYAPEMERATGLVVVENAAGQREGFEVAADIVLDPSVRPAEGGAAGAGAGLAVWQAALFALLGGVLLNLMPCVFPVLSLKAFGLIRSHGAGEAAARRDGLAYTAGIVASFLALAGLFLALRGAGAQIGWGFQLQSPPVVAGLALLLFVIGLNLAGMFDFGARFAGIGQGLTEKKGSAGSFFTGVLATVVATPCTAPFMAAALGYAVFQPVPVALAVFFALGLGLALPYLAISFLPAVRRLLPRPGAWMEAFRQFLAFPMFLTAAWLLWVLAQQAGPDAVALALAAMIATAFAIWLWRLGARLGTTGRASAAAVALALGFAIVHAGDEILRVEGSAGASASSANFEAALGVEPWSRERVAALRAEGRPVFVYFTAAWCITCKVNERVALADPDVIRAVEAGKVAVLKGDWTNQNADIAAVLARFGRNGVPLYLHYPAGAAEPEILPQVLLPETLISRLATRLAKKETL